MGRFVLLVMGLAAVLGCQAAQPVGDYSESAELLPDDVVVRVEGKSAEATDVSDEEGGTLTLSETVRRAVLHDPKIQAAIAKVRVAEADALQARLLPNPILSVSIRISEGGADPIFDAGLATELMAILQRPRKMSAADARLSAAAAEVLVAVADTIADAQDAYETVQAMSAQKGVLEERLKLADRLLELGKARLKAGESGSLDVIALETQRLETVVSLEEKSQELIEARLNLARLIGQPSSMKEWDLGAWAVSSTPVADERTWMLLGLRRRAEVRSKMWELAALGDELAIAKLAAWQGTEVSVQSEWDQSWSVGPGVALPLPIFDWGQAAEAKASAQIMQTRHELTQLSRQIVQEVRTQYSSYHSTLRTLRMAREQLLPLQERRAGTAESAYKAGETDIVNLLLAQQDLLETRVKVVELQKKAAGARVKLLRAVGGAGVVRELNGATTRPTTMPTRGLESR